MFLVNAKRIGCGTLTLVRLKIMQEVITLLIFVPFSMLYMKESFRLDFIRAGLFLCGVLFFTRNRRRIALQGILRQKRTVAFLSPTVRLKLVSSEECVT